jgi:predicted GIY-YIG superfamily endonuclease
MYFTYILQSQSDNTFYTGMSSDVQKRLKERNAGTTKTTKARAPWNVVHIEEFSTRSEARAKEKLLKTGAGREWRDAFLAQGVVSSLPAGRQGF